MIDPGANTRRTSNALDPDTQAMLRALLLCELIEQIDAAARNFTEPASSAEEQMSPRRVPGLDAMIEIRGALDRLDVGTYGACERCSRSIPLDELRRQPATRLCRACAPKNRLTGSLNWPR